MVNTSSPPSVVFRQYYKPYGEIAFQNGSTLTTVGYTGQKLDTTGPLNYNARLCGPVLTRFVSPDGIVTGASSEVGVGGGQA
jgi:RHS repeat-associated protein